MQFFRPLETVKAMTFDLDDTLYNNEPIIRHAERVLQAYLESHHSDAAKLTQKQWWDLKRAAISRDPRLASDMGQLRRIVLTAALSGTPANSLSIAPSQDNALNQAVNKCFDCFYDARSDFKLDPIFHETLLKVSTHIPLIGITNGNVNADKIGINGCFETILHASVSRPMKPAKDMFDEAANILEIEPKHILHVGDNLIKDVYGAINAGYQAAWFACNRPMRLSHERVFVLPHVKLDTIDELTVFVS
jgi:putative hydrolase of the HAD superfamily